jgi:hypothetical protein
MKKNEKKRKKIPLRNTKHEASKIVKNAKPYFFSDFMTKKEPNIRKK